jgi:DNA-binding CsgD family transcriptional regulator
MLYGRTGEAAAIERMLDAARAGTGCALVIRGEAGIGKSALLAHARANAAGFRVLSARGLQAESELPFAALSDLLRPVLGAIDELPDRQAAAVRGALALGPPIESDRFATAAASLSMLATAAERSPLLMLVDDAHWIDGASLEALMFTARRLGSDPMVALFAIREGETDAFEDSGLAELVVGPLERDPSDRLLGDLTGDRASASVRGRLFQATGGNPLALVEVAESLSTAQLSGDEQLDELLPAAATVERVFLRRIEHLSEASRDALLVAAVGASDRGTEVEVACALAGADPAALREAEDAGLVRRAGETIEFRHPLLRNAVYRSASPEERHRAHRALAQAVDPRRAAERRAWHLAAAADGMDADAASALVEAAEDARRRGALTVAARALERAAEVTPDHTTRARLRYDAATNWRLAGDSPRARSLLGRSAEGDLDPLLRADIEHLLGQIAMWEEQPRVARPRLEAAANGVESHDTTRAAAILTDASLAALLSGDIPGGIGLGRRAHELAKGRHELLAMTGPLLANGLLLSGAPEEARALLMTYDAIPADKRPPAALIQIAPPLTWIEEYDKARSFLEDLIRKGRELSSPSILVPALWNMTELEYRVGRWDQGYAAGSEAVSLARDSGQMLHSGLAFVARIEAGRGLEADARAHAEEAFALSDQVGYGAGIAYSLAALGLLELGLGRTDAAVERLLQLDAALGGMGVYEPTVVTSLPDLIEACVRAGRPGDAEAGLRRLTDSAERSGFAWSNATAARCAGLLAGDDAYESCFERALGWHGRVSQPFEQARTQLCFGERLRRGRRVADARDQLRAALAGFEQLGAAPWVERAQLELNATGERRRPRGPETDDLTPREMQVALLVAQGSTNRETAAALFLTTKTIEFHLSQIYRKLGLRSRTELAHRMAAEHRPPAERHAHPSPT